MRARGRGMTWWARTAQKRGSRLLPNAAVPVWLSSALRTSAMALFVVVANGSYLNVTRLRLQHPTYACDRQGGRPGTHAHQENSTPASRAPNRKSTSAQAQLTQVPHTTAAEGAVGTAARRR